MNDPANTVVPLKGVIRDANSDGRFDLLLYDDGILAVKGNYLRTALLAGGAGMGGAGTGAAGVGAAAGAASRGRYSRKQRGKLSERSRADLLGSNPANHFIPRDQIVGIALKKRWYEHSVTVRSTGEPGGRNYSWKPALNNYKQVRQTVLDVYGTLVTCDR